MAVVPTDPTAGTAGNTFVTARLTWTESQAWFFLKTESRRGETPSFFINTFIGIL
jgi:hypothetical protein